MAEKITYSAVPERRLEGLWLPCTASEARRWAVYRIRQISAKRGQAKPRADRRLLGTFFGPDAEICARKLVHYSTNLGKAKPAKPNVLYRSLTKEQWERAQEEKHYV